MSRTAADPADLDDPDKYTVLPEAEVFDENTVYRRDPKTGRPTAEVLRRFTKEDLERYAAGTNKRDAEGCPCSMTIGHTLDGAPEKDQPEIIGAWRKFRVAWSGTKKRWVMMALPYVHKGREEEAKSYPKVSIEAWRHMPVLDPIAIMRRTPERPTQWTYAADGERWRFSMEDQPAGPMDPAAAPDAAAPDQEFQDKFSACMQSQYPQLQAMHDKFAAECAAPGATPAMTTPNAAAPAPPEGAERFSAMEAENKALKDRFAAIEATNAGLEKKLRLKDRRADLERLAGRFELNVDEELADCGDLPADKYAAHLKRVERYVPRAVDPASLPMVDAAGPAAGDGTFTEAKLRAATKYMADHADKLSALDHDEAWAKARKFAMTGKDD